MAVILRSAKELRRAYAGAYLSVSHLTRQKAADQHVANTRAFERLFSSASGSGSNAAHEAGAKAKGEWPLWGYVVTGATAGGIYYFYKHRQSVALNQSAGERTSRYTKVNSNGAAPPGTAKVGEPVPLPPFEGVDAMSGRPISLSDLKGDFAVLTFVDADDPTIAKDILQRLLQVIESTDRYSNMQYTQPVVVGVHDEPADNKEAAADKDKDKKEEGPGSKLRELIHNFIGERASNKKDKTELRFKGITGDEATSKIKEAVSKFEGQRSNSSASTGPGPGAVPGPDQVNPLPSGRGDLHLLTPEGDIVISFEEVAVPQDVAEEIAEQITHYKRSHPEWHSTKAVKSRMA